METIGYIAKLHTEGFMYALNQYQGTIEAIGHKTKEEVIKRMTELGYTRDKFQICPVSKLAFEKFYLSK